MFAFDCFFYMCCFVFFFLSEVERYSVLSWCMVIHLARPVLGHRNAGRMRWSAPSHLSPCRNADDRSRSSYVLVFPHFVGNTLQRSGVMLFLSFGTFVSCPYSRLYPHCRVTFLFSTPMSLSHRRYFGSNVSPSVYLDLPTNIHDAR